MYDLISKTKALNLITPVIDDEATEQERCLFFACLDTYPEVRKQFQSARSIKTLLQKRCPKVKAPLPLYKRIHAIISNNNYPQNPPSSSSN